MASFSSSSCHSWSQPLLESHGSLTIHKGGRKRVHPVPCIRVPGFSPRFSEEDLPMLIYFKSAPPVKDVDGWELMITAGKLSTSSVSFSLTLVKNTLQPNRRDRT